MNVDSSSPVKHRSILSRNRPYKNRYHVSTTSVQDRDLFLTHKADPDDLLVFGYESKLFPPDGNSAKIRKHLHLIPWNDDQNLDLQIDRYDCRGSLHDLSEFDSDSWNITHKMSEEESRLEDALDLERYKDLHAKEEMDDHQDEELKRLRASIIDSSTTYNEVSLQYNELPPAADADEYDPCEPTNDDEDEDEKPFIAPHSLAIPPEMEIPATEKMNAVIEKTAKFISQQGLQMEIVLKAKQANNSQFQFLQFEHYLNPYYKHMVKRISEGKYNPGQAAASQEEEPEEEDSESDSDDDGNYLHPSLFASSRQKTTESKENEEKMKVINTAVDLNHPLAKLIEQGKKANAMRKYEEMARLAQHNNSNGVSSITAPPMPSYAPASSCDDDTTSSAAPQLPEDHHILPPPPDLQLFVEDIARRAAVEGTSIESSLLSSDSATYCFLQPWHELHPYYSYRKIAWIHAICPPPPPANETDSDAEKQEEKVEEEEEEEVEKTGPISFCIKTKISTKPKPLLVTKLLEEAEVEDEEEELLAAAAGEQSGKQEQNGTTNAAAEDGGVTSTRGHTPSNNDDDDEVDDDDSDGKLSTVDKTKLAYMQHYENTAALQSQNVTSQPSNMTSEAAARPSLFTAVTPSGESASIEELRKKQADRRQKLFQFMQMREQQKQEKKVVDADDGDDVIIKVPAVTSSTNEEDIFDLSEPPPPKKEEVQPARVDVDDATELLASQLILTKKLDIGGSPVELSSEDEGKSSKSKKHHRKRKRSSSSSDRGGGKSKSKKSSKREKKSKKSSRHTTLVVANVLATRVNSQVWLPAWYQFCSIDGGPEKHPRVTIWQVTKPPSNDVAIWEICLTRSDNDIMVYRTTSTGAEKNSENLPSHNPGGNVQKYTKSQREKICRV